MTDAADLVLTNGKVHTLAPGPGSPWGDGPGDEVFEAVAIRDGDVVRVDSTYEIEFLVGADTDVLDLGGRVLLPGFVDAHTHLESTGEYLVHADLSGADSLDDAVETLSDDAADDREWLLGFGWDESTWPDRRYLTSEDLDRVSTSQPVAAIRVDMHTATLNSVAIERLREDLPEDLLEYEDGEPTGVVFEEAVGRVWDDVDRGIPETRDLIIAARDRAHELGVTGVHDKPGNTRVPRVCYDLDREDRLDLRVRIDYRHDFLDAVLDTGLRTDAGSEFVQMGGIKSFTDGSFGGRTAKLFEPYSDLSEDEIADRDDDGRGQWLVPPAEMADLVDRVDAAGLQLVTHAIGDEAIEVLLDCYEDTADPGGSRHRVEHAELVHDDHVERMASENIVASCQPNFLQWADSDGLYDQRLGEQRRRQSNRYGDLLDAGVPLAFGSDSMPMDPLGGVHHAVNAPDDRQQLSVTDALRAYTYGAAYSGFDEDRLGSIAVGKKADLVALDGSPWDAPGSIDDIEAVLTIVDGEVVYDDR